jgi:hypothetical protein
LIKIDPIVSVPPEALHAIDVIAIKRAFLSLAENTVLSAKLEYSVSLPLIGTIQRGFTGMHQNALH